MAEHMSFEDVVMEQKDTGGLISRSWSKIQHLDKEKITVFNLESRLEMLNGYWETFLKNHKIIMRDSKSLETEYVKDFYFDEIEEKYFENRAMIAQEIARLKAQAAAANKQSMERIEAEEKVNEPPKADLPEISDLPKFSGNILEWEKFKQKFQKLVDSSTLLTTVQKFTYLQRHLTGEPAQLLQGVPINESYYKETWEKLEKKYGNHRILSYSFMQILYQIAPAKKQASNEIDRLLKAFEIPYIGLKGLGKPMDIWDEWFAFLLAQKLDPTTRLDWITHLVDRDDVPKFAELCDFLKERKCNMLTLAEQNNQVHQNHNNQQRKPFVHQGSKFQYNTQKKPVSSRNGPPNSPGSIAGDSVSSNAMTSCLLCCGPHVLNYCDKFRKMDSTERRNMATKMNLCFNCLTFGHAPMHCPSRSRCLVCSDKHHSMLHPNL